MEVVLSSPHSPGRLGVCGHVWDPAVSGFGETLDGRLRARPDQPVEEDVMNHNLAWEIMYRLSS